MNVEYFDAGTMNIKCNKCDFEDNFYEYQADRATGSRLINKLWSQYLEYWVYWNLEFKSGDKCPKCKKKIYCYVFNNFDHAAGYLDYFFSLKVQLHLVHPF